MQFTKLELAQPILRAVAAEGYSTATPIQARTIPHVLAGRDVLGCAQTGTGKTAAFALPVLHRLSGSKPKGPRRARCLVLSPTRELALQIGESFDAYGKHLPLRQATIFGGVNQRPQVAAIRRGTDILIATPGRLLDLLDQGHVDLRGIETLILDEADRMLDMGFIQDIKKIVTKAPKKRQTLLFSANMPEAIQRLADQFLHRPAEVHIAPESKTADRVEQSVYFVDKRNKPTLLAHLLDTLPVERAIVFTRTKYGADRVVKQLRRTGVHSEAIHGNKSQNARARTLDNFRKGKTNVLIATDVASRGIDIDGVSHVVNFDLTHEPESYVHRIGRTARAGASGVAVSFCARDERGWLKDIERLLNQRLDIRTDHPPYESVDAEPAPQRQKNAKPKPSTGNPNKPGRRHRRRPSGKTPDQRKAQGGKPRRRRGGVGKKPS